MKSIILSKRVFGVTLIILMVLIMVFSALLLIPTRLILRESGHSSHEYRRIENVYSKTNLGMVAVGNKYTVGLCANGELMFAGESMELRRTVSCWEDVVAVYSSSRTIIGQKQNGTILIAGANVDDFAEVCEWNDITSVAVSDNYIAAVKRDGSVLSCAVDAAPVDTSMLFAATSVVAGDDYIAILNDKGVVRSVGNENIKQAVMEWKDIVAIAAGSEFVVGIDSFGVAHCTNGELLPSNNEDIAAVYAGGNGVVYADADGEVISRRGERKLGSMDNVAYCAIGNNHTAVMKCDGTVVVTGKEASGRDRTQLWDLRVAFDNDYITGFGLKMTARNACEIIAAELHTDEDIYIKEGTHTLDASAICGTGMSAYEGDKKIGELVIYGDTDGDGKITYADADNVHAHLYAINNIVVLDGAYLRAADTLHYVGGVGGLSDMHADNIEDIADGKKRVSQHYVDPLYDSIAASYAINRDVVGYIRIADTNVDYPILYRPNYYYNYYTIHHNYSAIGSIYPLNAGRQKNNVIAGHNARPSKKMFHQLHYVQNRGKGLCVYNNRIIEACIYGEYAEWEIFAVYETQSDEPVETIRYNSNIMDGWDDSKINEWIEYQLERSETDIGVTPTAKDEFMTLYTCGDVYSPDDDSQARLYIFLRCVSIT